MKLAQMCREHALALRKMAEEAPELELQLQDLADKWRILATIREKLYGDILASPSSALLAALPRRQFPTVCQ